MLTSATQATCKLNSLEVEALKTIEYQSVYLIHCLPAEVVPYCDFIEVSTH